MGLRINNLQIEWDDKGCIAKAEGFEGVMLTCPRCQALLPRDGDHRCGDKAAPVISKRKPRKKAEATQ